MVDEVLLEKIANYEPSTATVELLRNTPVALLVGVSGAGKDTILLELLKTGEYHLVVSHTTRPPRANSGVMEQDGVDYHFIDMATAQKMLDEQAFVEAKIYSNNIYGTSAAEIQKAHNEHKIATSDVEVKGVAEYVEMTPTVRPFFILPPNFEVWQQRFLKRYGGDEDHHGSDIKRRLQTALDELLHVRATDYYCLVVNDDLQAAVQEINELTHVESFIPIRDGRLKILDQLINDLQKVL